MDTSYYVSLCKLKSHHFAVVYYVFSWIVHYPRPLKFYQHFASFALRKITIFLHLKSSNQTGHGFQFANCQITGGCLEQFQLVSGCRTIVRKVLSQLIVFLIQLLYHIIPIKATSAAPH